MQRNIVTQYLPKKNGFFRPRITCVWGSAWKENLVENGFYPEDAVIVTGNWRYDQLFNIIKKMDVLTIKKHLSVPPDKKVIMIASGNQNVSEFINSCLRIIRTMDHVFPIIKLHPLDNPNPIYQAVKSYQFSKKIIIDELFEGLKIADVVVSQLSTVISEALLLDKRIIIANFTDLPE